MKPIDHYAFGNMTIAGRAFTSDLRIFPDGRIAPNWWRRQGHLLQIEDLSDLLESRPDLLIVGTGASGTMRPAAGLQEALQKAGIEVHFLPTAEAVQRFNASLGGSARLAACFHLTC